MFTDPLSSKVYPPYPGTWQEFCSWFADEQACTAYLEQLRWPTGIRCPKCEGTKGWRIADGRWSCSGCGRKVSVTAGTIFDGSRISLQEWFAAAWYMTNQKHGVSALGLQRLLGLGGYQTAWTILQKLRTAMVRPGRDRLRGSVEVDETYVGGIEHGVRGRGTERKFMVAIAIEVLSPKGFGRVRLHHVDDVSSASLVPFVCAAVEAGSDVRTDGWRGYNGLSAQGYRHQPINISPSGDPAHVSMPGVHSVASLLKRWLLGTHQPTRVRLQPSIWTPISMNLPFVSIAVTPAAEACSSSGFCNMLSSPHPLGIGHRVLAVRWKTTAYSGHCTQAATPLNAIVGVQKGSTYAQTERATSIRRADRGTLEGTLILELLEICGTF